MRADLKMLAEGVVETVRSYVRPLHEALAARVSSLEKRLEALPAARDGTPGKDGAPGKDVDEDEIVRRVLAGVAPPAAGRDGKDGADGRSLSAEELRPLVVAETARAVAALPAPLAGRDGRDGLNGARGEKGADGSNGRDGADGINGLGFDDLTVEHDGDRGFTLKFQQGERTKSFAFALPLVLDRGVFKEGQEYARGDAATWAGSLWIVQTEKTTSKPDAGDGTWRLAVKRGRDGRDGKDGVPGDRGPQGERGLPGQDGRRYA